MKRALTVILLALLPFQSAALGEDSVSVWGNYYKERSTRVISPMTTIRKDLPGEVTASVTYLVDQITSASVAAGALTDEAFNEYRHEVGGSVSIRLFDRLIPSVNARYSTESDYDSLGFGTSLALELFERNTTLSTYFQYQTDDVRQNGRPGFFDELDTYLVGLGVTQILTPELVVGVGFEAQFLRGFQENVYRVEQHPRERDRYSGSLWARYRIRPSHTTVSGLYRLYKDTWDLNAHSFEISVTQRIFRDLQVAPRFRYHTQSDPCFGVDRSPADRDPGVNACNILSFSTSDPKLVAFSSRTYGAKLIWTLSFLNETWFDAFEDAQIQPAYYYLDQDITFGPAHVAQLGGYWPF